MKTRLIIVLFIFWGVLCSKTFTSPEDFTSSLTKVQIPDSLNTLIQSDSISVVKSSKADSLVSVKRTLLDRANLSENFFRIIDRLNVKDMELRDLLRGISLQYGINLAVDNSISQLVTLSLSDITVIDCLEFLCMEFNLTLEFKGSVLKIAPVPKDTQLIVNDFLVEINGNILSVDIRNKDLVDVIRKLSSVSGKNLIIQNGVSGNISGYFTNLAFDSGLDILMENNGYKVRKKDNVYYINYGQQAVQLPGKDNNRRNLWVSYDDGKLSFDLENADLAQVIKDISRQVDKNIISYGEPQGKVSAKCTGLELNDALNYLLKGTDHTYKLENGVYFIGDKKNSSLISAKLIKLKRIKSDGILEILPESLKRNSTIQIIKEQNALMVLGTNDIILELEHYIDQIDFPTPQILIEALVVDFNASDVRELGVMFGSTVALPDSLPWVNTAELDLGVNSQGSFSTQLNGQYLNTVLDGWSGIANLGRLPDDFYLKIQALENQGKANIKSRPQIATLNGHSASISIGTTQYYILKTVTPVNSAENIVTQQSERFEQVEANVTLSIVPWVSSSGDVTVEIHPEFKTPVGTLSSNTPPTINSRILDSTVRLKDGETIILGGLIQESESKSISKVPILGDLPILGYLFRASSKNKNKTELMIYITPHVFYGDDTDNEKWNLLRQTIDKSERKK
jgi:type IV pilus assembly protein PilQ